MNIKQITYSKISQCKSKHILSSENVGISGVIDKNEQHHILWISLAFHYSVLLWLDIRAEDGESEEHFSCESFSSALRSLHLCSVATQLAWTLFTRKIDVDYHLPPFLNCLENVETAHKQLQNKVVQLEERINKFDGYPSHLMERLRVLKKKIR